MSEDPILVLERELVMAARRRSLRASRMSRLRVRPLAGAAALLIPVLAVIFALSLTGAPTAGSPPVSPRPLTLTGELAILRRPQLTSDLTGQVRGTSEVTVERRLLRRVALHVGLRLIPLELVVSRRHQRDAAPELSAFATLSTRTRTGASALMMMTGDATATQIARTGILMPLGRWAIVAIVPDGVAAVSFELHGRRHRTLTRRAPVSWNIASLSVPDGYRSSPAVVRWYGAHGQMIRRIPHPR